MSELANGSGSATAGGSTSPDAPAHIMQTFEHQWAALVTTYRRDGTGVATAMHLAVDGDHGYFGTASDTAKVKRIRRDPNGQVAACSARGKVTGPTFPCRLRILQGEEAVRAERAIKHKYPIVQGVVISLIKVLKGDPGVYVELTPVAGVTQP
jgi:PPOX class probable F420-dependent enzyme